MLTNASAVLSTAAPANAAMSELFPAVIRASLLIFIGFAACQTGLITSNQAKGLGRYISLFALPSLIFRSVATLDFSDVIWSFLSAICIAKLIVFVPVVVLVLLVAKHDRLGLAGILAIFCTQTNDFSLGLPILNTLYPNETHYLYLFAPISFLIVNPIGFVLMEAEKVRKASDAIQDNNTPTHRRKALCMVWDIFWGIVRNPLVFMSALAVVCNFLFQRHLPLILDQTLKTLSDSFTATALFYLGIHMVGKVSRVSSGIAISASLLVVTKLILSPFLMREVVHAMVSVNLTESKDLEGFSFLYGGLPTAPTVFLYASQFCLSSPAPELIACALVVSTFLCLPLMYVSAWLTTLGSLPEDSYASFLCHTAINLSVLSAFSLGVFVITLIPSRRWRRLPQRFLVAFSWGLLCLCVGTLVSLSNQRVGALRYIQFMIFFYGSTSGRCWTSVLACILLCLRSRGLCFVLRNQVVFYLAGFLAPLFITGVMLMLSSNAQLLDVDPTFQFGSRQYAISLIVILVNLGVTITCLVLHQRSSVSYPDDYQPINSSGSEEDEDVKGIEDEIDDVSMEPGCREDVRRYVSARLCRGKCPLTSRDQCTRRVSDYKHQLDSSGSCDPTGSPDEEFLTSRLRLLLLLLVLSMVVASLLLLWRLIHDARGAVYIELEFLDAVCNYGQGLLVLALFGWDWDFSAATRQVDRLNTFFRRIFYANEEVILPPESFLDPEVLATRRQFVQFHFEKCVRGLGIREGQSFNGCDLVSWLEASGVASDRAEAVAYGERLLLSRVLHHIRNRRHFCDGSVRYEFWPSAFASARQIRLSECHAADTDG